MSDGIFHRNTCGIADQWHLDFATDKQSAASWHYATKFGHWYERASVRSRPRRTLDQPGSAQFYFPPELAPAAGHPLLIARGPKAANDFLVLQLYQYLSFTVELEEVIVLPLAAALARGRSGLFLPLAMREDAFKIATDEAWHAQFSFDLIRQAETATLVEFTEGREHAFKERLDIIRRGLGQDLSGVLDLLFGVVSETLISGILSSVPRDTRLPEAVRATVADHAQDEGRHHSFFRVILEFLWHALDQSQRNRIGPWVPRLIATFLEPDYARVADGLIQIGLTTDEIDRVLSESYSVDRVRADVAAAARITVRYFQEVGALDDPCTRDSFTAAGLLTGEGC